MCCRFEDQAPNYCPRTHNIQRWNDEYLGNLPNQHMNKLPISEKNSWASEDLGEVFPEYISGFVSEAEDVCL
jgi:hypothetical protein